MVEFFCGWKRKPGVVTLVLPCAFAVGWVRSHRSVDIVTVCWSGNWRCRFVSDEDGLWWITSELTNDAGRFERKVFPRLSTLKKDDWRIAIGDNPRLCRYYSDSDFATCRIEWHQQAFGFQRGQYRWYQPAGFRKQPEYCITLSIIPFSCILPLPLVSAWLLLSKPRRAQKPATPYVTNAT